MFKFASTAAVSWRWAALCISAISRSNPRRKSGSVMAGMRGPIIAFLLMAASLTASDRPAKIADLVHTKWSGGDIPFGAVMDLAQTKDGPLWLATDQGLFGFDGVRFTRFEPLSRTRIRHLVATRDGSLWVVFRTGRVSRLSGGKVTTFPLEELAQTNAIAEDGNGSIVAATVNGGLARFRDGHWHDGGGTLHHSGKLSLEVWFDRDGVLWLATEAQLFKFPRGANYFSDTGLPAHLTMARQHVFAQSPDGTVWFADRLSTRPVSPILARSEVNVFSNAVMVDRQGSLWVASWGEGLQRVPVLASIVNKKAAGVDAKPEKFTMRDGLSGSRVFCLLEDREGNVWAGTDAGLDRFSEGDFHRVRVSDTDRIAGLSKLSDGGVLVQMSSQPKLQRIEPDGRVETLHLPLPAFSTCEDTDGTIWVGTSTGFGKWTGHGISYPLQKGQSSVVDLGCGYGDVWMRSLPRGVMRFSAGEAAIVPGLRLPAIVIFPNGPGVVWATYPNGRISVYDNGALREYGLTDGLTGGAIQRIVKAVGGELWLAGEGGLARFRNGRFERADIAEGLQLQGEALGDDGYLWLSGGGRLMKMDVREFDRAVANPGYRPILTHYGAHDGITGVIKFITRSGKRIWVASSEGVWYLNLDPHPTKNPSPPPVQIETVGADGKIMTASQGITLPKLIHSLQIDYTAFSMLNPEQVHFRYKLEGVDKDWQDPGTRRQAYYNDPSPGKHRFLVQARNRDGVWNEAGASLDFTVAPVYYQMRWVQALCVFGVGALLWVLYRLRLRQMSARVNLLYDERLAERTRIARDLHDTLLQSLAGVSLQLHGISKTAASAPEKTPSQVDRIRQQVDAAFREARLKVYNLRSPALEGQGLAEALGEFMECLRPAATARSILRITGEPVACTPEIEEELLRIAQEAANNANRHAGATEIRVEVEYRGSFLKLSICDDGRGFHVKEGLAKSGHWGLKNMQERAAHLAGKCTITSAPGNGTKVEVHVPLRRWSLRNKLGNSADSYSGD
jgi:signal transduction histidine kinase/ligand-binding sensor domain-containing protein